ncbi:hypothetical protein U0355_04470 [Salimicrobium sp. PL1-032A]|uniref:hypothetical protein n=1 Tax=Salimicrobium sp. PL1-032A TaxID=3095364 RepID=UPI003261C9A7
MSNIIRFKILWTDQVIESRRVHMFDMKTQSKISFNYELMDRAPSGSVGKELRSFLKQKQKKINSGYYDEKGHAS